MSVIKSKNELEIGMFLKDESGNTGLVVDVDDGELLGFIPVNPSFNNWKIESWSYTYKGPYTKFPIDKTKIEDEIERLKNDQLNSNIEYQNKIDKLLEKLT